MNNHHNKSEDHKSISNLKDEVINTDGILGGGKGAVTLPTFDEAGNIIDDGSTSAPSDGSEAFVGGQTGNV